MQKASLEHSDVKLLAVCHWYDWSLFAVHGPRPISGVSCNVYIYLFIDNALLYTLYYHRLRGMYCSVYYCVIICFDMFCGMYVNLEKHRLLLNHVYHWMVKNKMYWIWEMIFARYQFFIISYHTIPSIWPKNLLWNIWPWNLLLDWISLNKSVFHALFISQWAHDAMKTSLLCQNDVATSFWRTNDVVNAPYASWDNTEKVRMQE